MASANAWVFREVKTSEGFAVIYVLETDIQSYYIVALERGFSEKIWGIGLTIRSAVEEAVKRWQREVATMNNPFEEVKKDFMMVGLIK
ncbi:hypothetical protein SPV3_ORF46 [Sulfolobus polyhedral virus 3]|nr:hypothetical protein SPV3_ORF46 [Sulfolobus polyhedral virus 3]